jgi:hypothetical protein
MFRAAVLSEWVQALPTRKLGPETSVSLRMPNPVMEALTSTTGSASQVWIPA